MIDEICGEYHEFGGDLPEHLRIDGVARFDRHALQEGLQAQGFTVELVASEPELVNPVAMTFDEKGRIWVAESLEYPRRSAGPGRDRIKVFEDTDGDGKYETVTVFAEGLNIPSGIAVGHGGVWVANSPDILFYKVGPDLKAALGGKSAEDLLIAILDPNREVDPRYLEYIVVTKSGKLHSGRIVVETGTSLTLRRAEGAEDVILRADIDTVQATAKSLMPEGLENQLSPQDVADVIAYLQKAVKAKHE